jgi:hypothetical protein
VLAGIASHVGVAIADSLVEGFRTKGLLVGVLVPVDMGIGRGGVEDRIEIHLVRGVGGKAFAKE